MSAPNGKEPLRNDQVQALHRLRNRFGLKGVTVFVPRCLSQEDAQTILDEITGEWRKELNAKAFVEIAHCLMLEAIAVRHKEITPDMLILKTLNTAELAVMSLKHQLKTIRKFINRYPQYCPSLATLHGKK